MKSFFTYDEIANGNHNLIEHVPTGRLFASQDEAAEVCDVPKSTVAWNLTGGIKDREFVYKKGVGKLYGESILKQIAVRRYEKERIDRRHQEDWNNDNLDEKFGPMEGSGYNGKDIVHLSSGRTFSTQTEAAKAFGVTISTIGYHANGHAKKQRFAYKFACKEALLKKRIEELDEESTDRQFPLTDVDERILDKYEQVGSDGDQPFSYNLNGRPDRSYTTTASSPFQISNV